jgi:hypothetical protein
VSVGGWLDTPNHFGGAMIKVFQKEAASGDYNNLLVAVNI